MATEVSSPPEYASTTFPRAAPSATQKAFEGGRGPAGGMDHDDGVVARQGAHHAGQLAFVDGARNEVGAARVGVDHGQELDGLDPSHVLSEDHRAVAALGADQTQLLDVTRHRRLGGLQALARERVSQLLLGVDRPRPDQVQDRDLPLLLQGSAFFNSSAAWSTSFAERMSGGSTRML